MPFMSTDGDSRGNVYLSYYLGNLNKIKTPIDDERFPSLKEEWEENQKRLDLFISAFEEWDLPEGCNFVDRWRWPEEYKQIDGFTPYGELIKIFGMDNIFRYLISENIILNPFLTNKSQHGLGRLSQCKIFRFISMIDEQSCQMIENIALMIVGYKTTTKMQLKNAIKVLNVAGVECPTEVFMTQERHNEIMSSYRWTKEIKLS